MDIAAELQTYKLLISMVSSCSDVALPFATKSWYNGSRQEFVYIDPKAKVTSLADECIENSILCFQSLSRSLLFSVNEPYTK